VKPTSSNARPMVLRSGQMTSGEAARTNQNQANVAQQVHDERVANGGALTAQQKQQANKAEKQEQPPNL